MAGCLRAARILLAVGLCAVLPFGLLLAVDAAFPPNVVRYADLSVEVRSADGHLLRAYLSTDDKWRLGTSVAEVDPNYLLFLKAYEDKRFDTHWGVDPLAAARAAGQALTSGRIVSGASTLTMQTARLLEPRPRGIVAKGLQAARALQLEWRYTKDEILSIYLTLAPFGGNLEGVRAASLAYFGKEPSVLTTSEAALLVALPQSPERLRPDRSGVRARRGRDKVLDQLEKTGVAGARLAGEARNVPVPEHRSLFPFVAPHFADAVKARRAPGAAVVRTGIDYRLQVSLESLGRTEAHWFPDTASMAAIIANNETREILAYMGGLDFWGPYGQVDLTRAVRSPGSALKPFVYGLGFDDLPLHPETQVSDEPTVFGDYAPQNFSDDFQGTVSIRDALRMSLNVPAVAVLERVGPERLSGALRLSGAGLKWPKGSQGAGLPMALGGVGISLFDLTTLYTALANGGEASQLILEVDGRGALRPVRLMSERAAWQITDILSGSPLPEGWARGRGLDRERTVAFKTGTSYGFRDAWALGYSSKYTVGVWIGRPDGSARAGQFGRRVAAPVLLKIFDLLPAENDAVRPRPDGILQVPGAKALPEPMRHFVRKPPGVEQPNGTGAAPTIVFPPDGAVLALGSGPEDRLLELRASGGAGPFRWLVAGNLLPEAKFLEPTRWEAPGPGFVRFVAIDAEGRTARAEVRIAIETPGASIPPNPMPILND